MPSFSFPCCGGCSNAGSADDWPCDCETGICPICNEDEDYVYGEDWEWED
jgi:hypothetical protein